MSLRPPQGNKGPLKYTVLRTLGQGGQGSAFLVKRKGDHKLMVCKTMKKPHLSNGLPKEVRILRDILPNCRRITKYYDCRMFRDGYAELYIEYCDGGDLSDVITKYDKRGRYIPESFMWHVLKSVAEALSFIHYGVMDTDNSRTSDHSMVIHRDMKPANIFLKWGQDADKYRRYPDVKLADFGIACVVNDPNASTHEAWSTPSYAPPEAPVATTGGDMWGLGAILHDMAHSKPPIAPFPPYMKTRDERVSWAQKNKLATRLPSAYSSELNRAMMVCLELNRNDRPRSESYLGKYGPVAKRKRDSNFVALLQ